MPNFIWLLQSVEDKMDVSQDFTDSPRKVEHHENTDDKNMQQ